MEPSITEHMDPASLFLDGKHPCEWEWPMVLETENPPRLGFRTESKSR